MDPATAVVPGRARVKPSQDQARGRWTRREGLRSLCRVVALGTFSHPRSLFRLVHLFPGLRKRNEEEHRLQIGKCQPRRPSRREPLPAPFLLAGVSLLRAIAPPLPTDVAGVCRQRGARRILGGERKGCPFLPLDSSCFVPPARGADPVCRDAGR